MVEIEVVNRSGVELDGNAAATLARDVLAAEGVDEGELGLTLVGPDEATDALAFPIDGRDGIPDELPRQLGDVVLCPQVTGDAWRPPLVHALLHLLGYDHGPAMEARERALAR